MLFPAIVIRDLFKRRVFIIVVKSYNRVH